jgi:hypothetical protein
MLGINFEKCLHVGSATHSDLATKFLLYVYLVHYI